MTHCDRHESRKRSSPERTRCRHRCHPLPGDFTRAIDNPREHRKNSARPDARTHHPECGNFFINAVTGTSAGRTRTLTSILGKLAVTNLQAQQLGVKPYVKLSPFLELCCLRVSANVSYAHAAQDVEFFTGSSISANTQQRLVHRQEFALPRSEQAVEELSVDGGKIRLRTPQGQESVWRDYKAACLCQQSTEAFFQNNSTLIDWVNDQPLAPVVTCLGDGHDGIWNIISEIAPLGERREILDWYHLVENLHKVGGSCRRLNQAESLLWRGQIAPTIALFADCTSKQARNFCKYLDKHRHRIVNYEYLQAEQICSIGSGAVESAVKQIDRRTKISGAQWNKENVPQVLAHRCAYLNGLLTV